MIKIFCAAISEPGKYDKYLKEDSEFKFVWHKKHADHFTLEEVLSMEPVNGVKLQPREVKAYELAEPTKVDKMFKAEGFSKQETNYEIVYSSWGCRTIYVFKKNKEKVYIWGDLVDFETDFMEGIECVKTKVEELGWELWEV